MTDHAAAEEPLTGGFVNQVVRVGDTVRRSAGPWTPAVHALLRHLERAGFAAAPRVLGMDDRGREVLSYLPGEAMPWTDWPDYMRSTDGPARIAALLRRYHDAVRDFRPPPGAVWRNPLAPADGELVRHGDFSPFNTLWQDGQPVGLVDWDFAQPGRAVTDLAYLAWTVVPLQGAGRAREYGFDGPVDRTGRLRALCAAYGGEYEPAAVVAEAVDAILTERDQTAELAARGVYPWTAFAADGGVEGFGREAGWIRAHTAELLDG